MMSLFVRVHICFISLLAYPTVARSQVISYDSVFSIELEGKVCDGRVKGPYCLGVNGVLVSLGDPYHWEITPLDYTNWQGEFVLHDRGMYGYSLDEGTGEIVSGTSVFRPFLSFKKQGFRELRIDLRGVTSADIIESASPLCVALQPAGSVREGTAGFSPLELLPTLPSPAQAQNGDTREAQSGENR